MFDTNEKIKDELDRIVSVLAETEMVAKIILFGSYAGWDYDSESDIDIMEFADKSKYRNIINNLIQTRKEINMATELLMEISQ
jgi:predicted nucleotidyltransferase